MNLLLIAVAPAMIIMIYVYFKDKIEKEPVKLVVKHFLLGAFVSVLITSILSGIMNAIFSVTDSKSVFQQFIKAFLVVALVEEFSKYIIVRYSAQPNKEFKHSFDGIVYAVAVSLGFATLENILYTFQYGMSTGVIRAFTAVPAHATFAILMGYYMGKAKFSNKKNQHNLLGLLLAIVFHGLYDFFLFINFIPGISVGAFISLIVGGILAKKAIDSHDN